MTMKKMENVADCTLWTPWGPQFTEVANPKLESLRRTLRRMKAKPGVEKRERDAARLDKPECSYEP